MNEITLLKYKKIREDYRKWRDKKYKGVRIYAHEYILLKLSEKYFLKPKTIEHIVFYRYPYNK